MHRGTRNGATCDNTLAWMGVARWSGGSDSKETSGTLLNVDGGLLRRLDFVLLPLRLVRLTFLARAKERSWRSSWASRRFCCWLILPLTSSVLVASPLFPLRVEQRRGRQHEEEQVIEVLLWWMEDLKMQKSNPRATSGYWRSQIGLRCYCPILLHAGGPKTVVAF